jgi:hypothetical protein
MSISILNTYLHSFIQSTETLTTSLRPRPIHCLRKQRLLPSRPRKKLHMLMRDRRAAPLAAIENRHVPAPQSPKHLPQRGDIGAIERVALRLQRRRVQHQLRPHRAELVQDQLVLPVAAGDEAEVEVAGAVGEGRGAAGERLAGGVDGFFGDAGGDAEVELVVRFVR